jgi:glucan 1,3-beta-glucosidase
MHRLCLHVLARPAGFYDDVLSKATQYWYDSFGNIRYPYGSDKKSDTIVLLHDAFKGLSYWNDFMTDTKKFDNVAFDTHIYQMFSQDVSNSFLGQEVILMTAHSQEVSRSDAAHIDSACNNKGALSSFHLLTIVGKRDILRHDGYLLTDSR